MNNSMTMYRIKNNLLCVNFTKDTLNWINDIIPTNGEKNVSRIHIFVFNIKDVDIRRLTILANACIKRRIKCFVHCFKKENKETLKQEFVELLKSKFFSINFENHTLRFGFSNGKYIDILGGKIKITTPYKDGYISQNIIFNHDEYGNKMSEKTYLVEDTTGCIHYN